MELKTSSSSFEGVGRPISDRPKAPAKMGLAASCQMCKSPKLHMVLDLGFHAPADAFIPKERLNEPETRFPLRLVSCEECGLLQLDYIADRETFYKDGYAYVSSTTATGRAHYAKMAEEIVERFGGGANTLAIDVGSNAGILLEGFKTQGLRVLGVDPAELPAKEATSRGIETVVDFFDEHVAEDIATHHGQAKFITGTNVFAHLHERDSAVRGMQRLLTDDGIIIIEAPYAIDLIESLAYDTIYLEHLAYLSVRPMRTYLESFGLELFDIERRAIHGGTLRYYIGKKGIRPIAPTIAEAQEREDDRGLYRKDMLATFADRVRKQRQDLLEMLIALKKEGKRIVGLSAPAKGNTLLTYCNLNETFLDYLTDRNPLKVGLYSPSTHLKVLSDDDLLKDDVEYALLLAWNFADEIMHNMEAFKARGGKFIIPVPTPRIV